MGVLFKIFAVAVIWTCVRCDNETGKQLYFQKSSDGDERLVEVTWTDDTVEVYYTCKVYTNKDNIKEVLESSEDASVQTFSKEDMNTLLDECDSIVYISSPQSGVNREDSKAARRGTTTDSNGVETTTAGYDGMPVIFPGTKWCGAGDIAKSYDDLGLHQDTDRCCRAHDLCNDTLAPGESRNNLTNNSKFTKLSCQCDNDFYDCLSRVNSVTSNTIGNMYFNLLTRECYKEDYPQTKKCKKYFGRILKIKCVEYERDTAAPKVAVWVRARKYKNIPIPGPLTITLPF